MPALLAYLAFIIGVLFGVWTGRPSKSIEGRASRGCDYERERLEFEASFDMARHLP